MTRSFRSAVVAFVAGAAALFYTGHLKVQPPTGAVKKGAAPAPAEVEKAGADREGQGHKKYPPPAPGDPPAPWVNMPGLLPPPAFLNPDFPPDLPPANPGRGKR